MFIRFITSYLDADGDIQTGVFQAAAYLRKHSQTRIEDVDILEEYRGWFNQYLDAPDQFTKRKTHQNSGTALGWYRDTASDHIANMYELAKICEPYGIIFEIVKRADPGYIVYEDEYQVAAIPYREDRNKVT
jgi:hypothetical protein